MQQFNPQSGGQLRGQPQFVLAQQPGGNVAPYPYPYPYPVTANRVVSPAPVSSTSYVQTQTQPHPQQAIPHQQQPGVIPQQPQQPQHKQQIAPQAPQQHTAILTRERMYELLSQIDPNEKLDADVEEILLEIADDFVESVTSFACCLAIHRRSQTLEPKDFQLHLERNWNIRVPGFTPIEESRASRRMPPTEVHRKRVAEVRKLKSSN